MHRYKTNYNYKKQKHLEISKCLERKPTKISYPEIDPTLKKT